MRGKKGITNMQEGDVFGELTYIKHVGYYKHNAIGEFLCSCGAICEKPITNVVHGQTLTCGHIQESRGIGTFKAKKKYTEEKQEGFFDYDAYVRSDFILQS